jgi:acyl-CoA oxidase
MLSELKEFLEPQHDLKTRVYHELLKEPLFCPTWDHESSLDDRALLAKQLRRATELGLSFSNPIFYEPGSKDSLRAVFSCLRDTRAMWSLSLGLHAMFAGVCESLGTKQHERYFKSSAEVQNLSIFGCFALTELAHGSNAQGILTSVTYQSETKNFVINTPLSSSGVPIGAKWWVGNAAKHATHAVVAANLIVSSVSKGLHFFVVQLRDQTTLLPLPGITVGDLGPKSGPWNAIDNGFMVFSNVSLPLSALLDKYQFINVKTGQYEAKIDPNVRFGRTLGGRKILKVGSS